MSKEQKTAFLYVFSTLASDNLYTNYEKGANDLPIEVPGAVLIHGGAGVTNSRFVVPGGVVTPVTAEQLEYLNKCYVYRLHKQNGFIIESMEEHDAEQVAADMNRDDKGKQLIADDFVASGQKATTAEVSKPAKAAKGK